MTKSGYHQESVQSAHQAFIAYKWVDSINSLIDLAKSDDAGEAKSVRRPACKTRADASSQQCVNPAPRSQSARRAIRRNRREKKPRHERSRQARRLHTST
jgi:hypothetical protein